jgi:hypothetical protein
MKKSKALKKQGYKKKFKGTRYIAKVLKKYGGKKYKDYASRVAKSNEIYETLKANNQKVSVQNIQGVFRKHRPTKQTLLQKEKPLLFYKLKREPIYFFDLADFPNYIKETTNKITFVSEIFNEGFEEAQGGSKFGYENAFSEFVNFVNKSTKQRDDAYGFLIKVTDPEEINGRWISRIVSIDPSGEEDNFGFEPGVGSGIGSEPRKIKSGPKQPESKPTNEQIDAEIKIKQLDAETKLTNARTRENLTQLFLKGELTKAEFKEYMALIK